MFEIGWTEMLVIAIVLIVVVGPKDLPKMLRTFGRTTAKLRVMAGDFRKQFDEALKEAELDDVKTMVDDARKLDPTKDIREALNPMQKAAEEVRTGLQNAMNPTKPAPAPQPASSFAQSAEPAKAGPAAIPGEPAPVQPQVNGHAVAAMDKPAKPVAAKTAKPKTAAAPKKTAAKPRVAKPRAAKKEEASK